MLNNNHSFSNQNFSRPRRPGKAYLVCGSCGKSTVVNDMGENTVRIYCCGRSMQRSQKRR